MYTSAFPNNADKQIVLPGSPAFNYATWMANNQFQRKPAAVLYAYQTSDVQDAVKCAYKNGVRVAVASGRHSYKGWSVVSDYLVVDTSNMTTVKVLPGRQGPSQQVLTAEVGPGNTNALLISQLNKQGYSTAGTIIGQCPSVSVSGYILGGGQGDLSRMFGLACDQLVALEMVTYTGERVIANAKQNSGLLWASCGGGGGLGVITKWIVKAHDLGKEPFSRIQVGYNSDSAISGMLKMQEFIMSNKTDLRFSGGGAALGGFNLYFAGPLSTAMQLLKEGGLLNPAWLDKGTPSRAIQSRAHLNQPPLPLNISSITAMPPFGVEASTYANYYEAIMMAECQWVAGTSNPLYAPNAAKYGFGVDKSCDDLTILNRFKELAGQPGSPINSGISDIWRAWMFTNACRLLPPLNATAWKALVAVIADPSCKPETPLDPQNPVKGLTQALKAAPDKVYYCLALAFFVGKPTWNHLLGGAVANVPQTATAYPWRKAISPMCFDSGLPLDMVEPDGKTLKTTYALSNLFPGQNEPLIISPAALAKGIEAAQAAYLKALYDVLGKDLARHAYYNYQTNQVEDYEAAYWGPNYNKLQQLKAKWDPQGLFSKPFTVQPAART